MEKSSLVRAPHPACSSFTNLPVITQCEIRKLYAQNKDPGVNEAIDLAKTLERRRCGHHPDKYPEPLSTLECFKSVVDPKDTNQNKHRYVVASQSQEVRKMLRGVRAVPLIYIKRSVMILEPMADDSAAVRAREERGKFRAEIKHALGKRKREANDEEDDSDEEKKKPEDSKARQDSEQQKKKKGRGPKGPNPLAVQKTKKKEALLQQKPRDAAEMDKNEEGQDAPAKRKRRRRAKTSSATTDGQTTAPETTTAVDDS